MNRLSPKPSVYSRLYMAVDDEELDSLFTTFRMIARYRYGVKFPVYEQYLTDMLGKFGLKDDYERP